MYTLRLRRSLGPGHDNQWRDSEELIIPMPVRNESGEGGMGLARWNNNGLLDQKKIHRKSLRFITAYVQGMLSIVGRMEYVGLGGVYGE
jgi:hypothetical protein